VAQLTQADDNAAGSGRQPRRLKTLFKNLVRQTQPEQKSAPQVAAAENQTTPRQLTERKEATTSTSAAPAQNATPAQRPTIKVSQLGLSWNKLRLQSQRQKNPLGAIIVSDDDDSQHQPTNEKFTQQELELQWLSMCNRMPQRLSGIAARLKNINPRITTFPEVEVVVPNEIIKTEVETIKGSIVNTLKLRLDNDAITLVLRVAERTENTKILTRREQFELMAEQNPSVEKLRKAFDLKLA